MPRRPIGLPLVLALASLAADGPPKKDTTAETVAAAALDALKRSDWHGFTRQMHPGALRDIQGTLAPALEAADADSAGLRRVLALFGKDARAEELVALAPDQFFIRLMEGATAAVPRFRAAVGSFEFKVLGTVFESPDDAHVVYRSTLLVGDAPVSQVDVVSLKRVGNDWRVLPTADFRALTDQLRRALKPP